MNVTFPGFIDLQVNGFAGLDFNTPGFPAEGMEKALAAMRRTGVTRCLPTIITSSLEKFAGCAGSILACRNTAIAGLHMEGPYISPLDGARGAHQAAFVIPASVEDFKRRQDAARGRIVLVTLAPEVPGALKLIEYLVSQNVRVAIGHTMALREHIADAVGAGATMSTHLGNGCPQQLHRHENMIWEQLARDELIAGLVVDGHHLTPAVVKSMVRAKGLAGTVLVTDAISAAVAPPGLYRLGDIEVELNAEGRVAEPGKTNLAGSSLTLDVAVANTVRFCGLPLQDVLPLASTRPAGYLGIETAGQVEAEWDAGRCLLTVRNVIGN